MAETEVKSINGKPVADVTARAKIDEIKNAAPGLVFDTAADMHAYIAENAGTLKVGQDLFIREADAPDYWWDGTKAVEVETDLSGVKEDIDKLSEAIDAQKTAIESAGNEVYVLGDGETLDDAPESAKVVYDPNETTEEGEGGEGNESAGADVTLGISGATVGQIARITAVDDTGMPTAWDAVDEIRRTVLCDFTAAEVVVNPQIELSDNPFNYTTFIVDAKLTKPADSNPMFMMYLGSEDGRFVQISHLQSIASTSGTKLHGMMILGKDKAYSSFVKKGDYQWNSTNHYSGMYTVINSESYQENVLKFTNSTLQAGDYIRIEGVRG